MTANTEVAADQSAAEAIVFWRHGRTAWNANGRLQGQSDIELDEIGQSQIELAAQALAATFPKAVLITSDLKRARQTADRFAELTGRAPILDADLRERSFGQWEGLDRNQISVRWPEIFAAWQRGDDDEARPPGGESRREVGQRVAAAARRYAEQASQKSVLLIVSHGAAITAAITELLGEDAGYWHGITGLDNANWSVMIPSKSNPNWRLVAHNLGATPFTLREVFGA